MFKIKIQKSTPDLVLKLLSEAEMRLSGALSYVLTSHTDSGYNVMCHPERTMTG